MGWATGVQFPEGARDFGFFPQLPDRLRAYPVFMQWERYEGLFPGGGAGS